MKTLFLLVLINLMKKLGKYSHIIEDNKADIGSLAFLNLLEKEGFYDEELKKNYC